jgi:malonyl-ACP decarboxylase
MKKVDIIGVGLACSAARNYGELKDFLHEQRSAVCYENSIAAAGALISNFNFLEELAQISMPLEVFDKAKKYANRQSLATQTAIIAALQAWRSAGFFSQLPDLQKVSIIIAGDNFNQNEMQSLSNDWSVNKKISPSYAVKFMDSNLLGIISELLSIQGEGFTIGGASASGNVGIIAGARQVEYNYSDACLVVAPMMELSELELTAFKRLGVLATKEELRASFDQKRNGFFYGQGSAAMVLTKHNDGYQGISIEGYSLKLDGNSGADPSLSGEIKVMQGAIKSAGLFHDDIKYVNAHATGSILGDSIELQAIAEVFGDSAISVNCSKSMVGHCLSAAGMVESIIVMAQLELAFFHQNFYLLNPMRVRNNLDISSKGGKRNDLNRILKNSFGFGGINSCIIYAK